MPIPTAAACHTVPTTEPSTGSPKLALVGSPNGGKTSVFNQLTGLHAKTGNYPGVTVSLSLIHISAPTRLPSTPYAVFCLSKTILLN